MIQKHRISTNIGKDQLVNVELKQDYDLLEILSLRFTQQDAYTALCCDYGVVCGRISVNNGLGVPNARVSLFIPQLEKHANDPVISALYPYTEITDKDDNNFRYNLLPARQQHPGHTPTGTFPDQEDILTREEYLEVYESYYNYTVKTNSSGDFMIWGVPLGSQTIHVDVDLSDIGCFSLRPYDFIRQGDGVDKFKNKYMFKSSQDLNSLPQIVSFDKQIEVYPFWGNEDFCQIGLTRTDFELSDKGVRIQPTATIIGGIYGDQGMNAVNKNCRPSKKMGRKCGLAAKSGQIEAIRFTPQKDINNRPILETIDLNEDIPDDGSFVFPIEMNMDYVYTNEFGENEITNDPNKGIPTSACYRFRINMNDNDLSRARANADFLIPNIREFTSPSTEVDKSYYFGTEWTGYPINAVSTNLNYGILYSELGEYYPRDYFYRFNYNKVYTVSSFHSNYQVDGNFTNINELHPAEEEDCGDKLTPPSNFGFKNYTFTLLISDVLLLAEHLINLVTLTFLNALVKLMFYIGDGADFRPIRRLARTIKRAAFRAQENGQRRLYLINYPECEECNGSNSLGTVINTGGESGINCSVGSVTIVGDYLENSRTLTVSSISFAASTVGNCTGTTINIVTFIQNQSNYLISGTNYGNSYLTNEFSGTPSYGMDGITITGYTDIKFQDDGALFGEPFSNILTIRSVTDTESDATNTTIDLEEGCDIYDTPYDEALITYYYIGTGRTKVPFVSFIPGSDVTATNISGDDGDHDYYSSTLSDSIFYYPNSGVPLVSNFEGQTQERFTSSGQSEFQNGVFTIVPGTQTTRRIWDILSEYRRRKRVSKMFCGGIVNYAFIDNWLSGSLYFTQFKVKRLITAINRNSEITAKYCRNIARLVIGQKRLYYRSAPTSDGLTFTPDYLNKPTTFVDLGPRDEFIKEICTDPKLDPNCSVSRSIGATSYQDLGELLGLAINYRMDIANETGDLDMFFDNTGFSSGVGITNVLDGDILQLLSINNETGIQQFDLQDPRYLGYSYQFLDPEVYPQVFKNGNANYGPLPVTLELSDDGQRIRSCLNEEGRLTESSQIVPFYLWNKRGYGFGSYNGDQNNQSWDYSAVQTQPLQGMTYGYNLTGGTSDQSDKYLLLPITYTYSGLTLSGITQITGSTTEFDVVSITDGHASFNTQYPGFTYLYVTGGTADSPTSGTLYTRYGNAGSDGIVGWSVTTGWTNTKFVIKRTQDYYSGTTKQILSTPFQFYFGLLNGKTGLDKFVDYFGPKNAFIEISGTTSN